VTTPNPVRTVLIDGHYWYVGPNGWRHPAVMGGEGDDDGKGGAGPSMAPPPDTVSKAEADRLAKQARKDAERALLAQFGEGATPESIKAILDKQRADDEARKDEVTKAREAAEADRALAAKERAEAGRERLALKVQRALLAGNVRPERLESAARLVTVPDDADDDAVKAAVATFAKDTPEWFPAPGQPPAPSGLPGGGKPTSTPSVTGIAAGRERARREREERAKRPQFGDGLTPIGGQAS
jgi:hypothetical protein